jgi:hypothetical protein
LKVRTNFLPARARGAIGGVLASAVLLVSVGVATPSASAATVKSASLSPFCSTIINFRPGVPPSVKNLKSYKAWAKSLIPFYEKLASEAPNAATKAAFKEVVVVLKYYSNSASLAKLDASVLKYNAKWEKGSKDIASAIISCAKQLE